jgi:hypothetical protein
MHASNLKHTTSKQENMEFSLCKYESETLLYKHVSAKELQQLPWYYIDISIP